MTQLETRRPEEISDTCNLGDTGVFTLAGLDDDLESIDLQPNLDHPLLDGGESGCMVLDLDAPSAGFLCHASACPDASRFYDLCAALDQPVVLDLDSEDDEEMEKEEIVLDF